MIKVLWQFEKQELYFMKDFRVTSFSELVIVKDRRFIISLKAPYANGEQISDVLKCHLNC